MEKRDSVKKPIYAWICSFIMLVSILSVMPIDSAKAEEQEGKTLNIYTWNEEFISIVKEYYPEYEEIDATSGRIGNVEVLWDITPSDDNVYLNSLKEKLQNQANANADEKVDMFLLEGDAFDEFINNMDVCMTMDELGLSDAMANQYEYTQDAIRNKEGKVCGSTWQANPIVFVYSRSIAKKVFGTDNPETIQNHVGDWDTFTNSAEQLRKQGYKMVAGVNDMLRVKVSVTGKYLKNDTLYMPDTSIDWMDFSKYYVDKQYAGTCGIWSEEWLEGLNGDTVFGYFVPKWMIDFCMFDYDGETLGDWAAVEGPATEYWGGSWLCVAKGSDNVQLCADIIRTMTCDTNVLEQIASYNNDLVNNKIVGAKLAEEGEENPTLAGQNPYSSLHSNALKLTTTQNQPELFGAWTECLQEYLEGGTTKAETVCKYFNKAKQITGVAAIEPCVVVEESWVELEPEESKVLTVSSVSATIQKEPYTFVSSDSSVATVNDSGEVMAVDFGETEVVVSNGAGCEARVKVIVANGSASGEPEPSDDPEDDDIRIYDNLKYIITEQEEVAIVGVTWARDEEGDVIITPSITTKNMIIPETIDSKPVKMIGRRAFSGCNNLISIEIPDSVVNIEDGAFDNCKGLTNIKLPNGLTTIKNDTFYNCISLTSIKIPDKVTSIGDYSFGYCEELADVEISERIEDIGENAFYWCEKLTNFDLPNSIKNIGDEAFYACTGLNNLEFPNSLISIGKESFCGCENMVSINIPYSVTSIGEKAFGDCKNLNSIVVDSHNMVYDSRDESNAIIETKTDTLIAGCKRTKIPNSVTKIGNGAFFYCTELMNIEIPDSVVIMGKEAFCGCQGLTDIIIPNGITRIEDSLFFNCTNLTNIKLANNIASIGTSVFYECVNLRKIEIPASVISIDYGVFENCSKDLVILGHIDSYVEQYAKKEGINFEIKQHIYGEWTITRQPTSDKKGIKTRKCTVCGKEETEEMAATGNGGLSQSDNGGAETPADKQDSNPSESTDNSTTAPVEYKKGTDFSKGKDFFEVVSVNGNKGTVVYTGTATKNKKTITVPKTVTVEGKTFTVTEIADNAFKGNTKLTNVTVSTNITKIGKNTFSGCKNLKKITIKSTKLKKVGKNAFKGINKKAVIKVPKKQLAKYKKLFKGKGLPKTVKIK